MRLCSAAKGTKVLNFCKPRAHNHICAASADKLSDSLANRLSELADRGDEARLESVSEISNPVDAAFSHVEDIVTAVPQQEVPGRLFNDPSTIPDGCLPKVAILGRPNVGKSALFNRFSRTSKAIVFDKPGVTRDRLFVRGFWGNKEFMLIDTGGLPDANRVSGGGPKGQKEDNEEIPLGVEVQIAVAVEESDAVIFVVDGMVGLTVSDQEIISWLRSQHSNLPVVLAVNKCENFREADQMAAGFWELGMEPFPVSAISGLGTGDLLDALIPQLPPPKPITPETEADLLATVAILGRPNTGKSSLLNALVRFERSIVSSVPGTTRDAVDAEFFLKDGRRVKVVDTAGVRRRMAVYGSKDRVEPMMVEHSIRAIRQATMVILMIDAAEGVTQQDFKLSLLAAEEGCAVVVVANKYDLVDQDAHPRQDVEADVRSHLREVGWSSVVVTSMKEENHVKKITRAILEADNNHRKRVSTATLNMVVKDAMNWRPPPATRRGKKGRIYYATQPSIQPPTFVLFVNDTKIFTDEYKRFLKKQLRENIGFSGTPIHIVLRGKPTKAMGDFGEIA